MEIRGMQGIRKGELVQMGMADSDHLFRTLFFVDSGNMFPAICKEFPSFLFSLRMQRLESIQLKIILFFIVHDDVYEYVYDGWCGECRFGRKFVLTKDVLRFRQSELIVECNRAYQLYRQKRVEWENERNEFLEGFLQGFLQRQKPHLGLVK